MVRCKFHRNDICPSRLGADVKNAVAIWRQRPELGRLQTVCFWQSDYQISRSAILPSELYMFGKVIARPL